VILLLMIKTTAVRKLMAGFQAFQLGGARELMNRCQVNIRELRAWVAGVVTIDGCQFTTRNVPEPVVRALCSGPYEYPERVSIKKYIDPSLPIIELGGCVGVVSCISNRLLKEGVLHIVVEANPALVPLIHANAERNKCNIEVVHAAVSERSGTASFEVSSSLMSSSLLGSGHDCNLLEVPACTLSELLDRYNMPACNLICDIEGSEYNLVQHARKTFASRVRTIIMEVHPHSLGQVRIMEMTDILLNLGFHKVAKIDNVISFVKGSETTKSETS
jgi:FkbM family methyltransferase